MKAVKVVRFDFKPSKKVLSILSTFRQMCNDAIRIAIGRGACGGFDLIDKSYEHLKGYGLHTHYILNACEIAYAVYERWRQDLPDDTRKNLVLPYFRKRGVLSELLRRKIRIPHVKKPFLRLDNQTYRLDYLLLRIPIQPRRFAFIVLNGSLHHRSFLADKSLKKGSVTITESSVVVSFSKEIVEIEALGRIGLDVNERNITASDTSDRTIKYDTSGVAEIWERYRDVRAKIGRRTRQDR